MRKGLGIIIMLFGAVIIMAGVFLQTGNSDNSVDASTEKKEFSYVPLNLYDEEQICTTYHDVSTFINLGNNDKVSFSYPDCFKEYELSFWSRSFINDGGNVSIHAMEYNENTIEYLEDELESIKSDDYYKDVNSSDINTFINDNGLEVSFIQINLQLANIGITRNGDFWYIAVKIDDDHCFGISITSYDNVLAYDTIKNMINSIDLVEKGATLVNTVKKGDYQEGYIYQNKDVSYEHGYKIKLKVPNKYMEVESYKTDVDESIFQYQDSSQNVYIDLAIDIDSYRSVDEKMSLAYEMLTANRDNKDWKEELVDTGIAKEEIDGKEILQATYGYEDNKGNEKYLTYIYYKVADGFYYKIYINSENLVIDDDFIEQFLNFSVEEY